MLLRFTLLAVGLLASTSSASDWPQFRGPGGLSVADKGAIPATFGPDENVLWQTPLPAGQSSPCIVGKRIFVSGFEEGANIALAIERSSGKVLWKQSFEGSEQAPYLHPDAAPATPSPVSDGERVIFYFGNYGVVSLSVAGELEWEMRMPHPGHVFGVGSSPLLVEGLLIVPRDGAPEAAVLVFDASTGEELWRIDRFEYGESHGTPFLWRNADRDELIVSGTNRLAAYDLLEGKELWSVGGMTNFPCTTPTADEDTLYYAAWSTPNATGRSFWEGGFTRSLDLSDEEVADPSLLFKRLDADSDGKVTPSEVPECRAKDAFMFLDRNQSGAWEVDEFLQAPSEAAGRNVMVAVKRGAKGDASKSHVRWSTTRGLPYVSSPLLYKDRVWLFKSGGVTSCLDAETGKPLIDRERLSDRSEYYMSPVAADGKVIVGSAEGTLFVLDAQADELVIEHEATFDEGLFATPAVLDGVVYVRTKTRLWAFGDGRD